MDKKSVKSILALVCIAIVCTIVSPAIIGESASDSFLTVNTTSQITTLGSNTTYLITIRNTGNEADTYNLTTINIDNASVVVLNLSTITLDVGQSGNVTLNVTDIKIIGPYCVIVNATSQADAGVTDEVEIITAVVEDEEEE